MKKRKTSNLLIVIFLLILLLCLFLVYKDQINPIGSKIYKVSFSVGSSIGFDTSTGELAFGKIQPPGSSTREIIIENPYDYNLHGRIFVSDNLGELIIYPSYFLIEPKSATSLNITLAIPNNYTYGNYTGKLAIELRK